MYQYALFHSVCLVHWSCSFNPPHVYFTSRFPLIYSLSAPSHLPPLPLLTPSPLHNPSSPQSIADRVSSGVSSPTETSLCVCHGLWESPGCLCREPPAATGLPDLHLHDPGPRSGPHQTRVAGSGPTPVCPGPGRQQTVETVTTRLCLPHVGGLVEYSL